MVVVPAGSFMMGSPENEPERSSDEDQVRVSIAAPFAVGKYAVTFDEWDACDRDTDLILVAGPLRLVLGRPHHEAPRRHHHHLGAVWAVLEGVTRL